uniref:Uncharacterized protein n=1 Tax=Ciona intestinalis TaxID=7719 RepID=H2Y2Y4_CIOIN
MPYYLTLCHRLLNLNIHYIVHPISCHC